jgi:hypothetical protein
MTQHQWQTIEKTLAGFTVQDKLELVARLMRSIQADVGPAGDHTREQLEKLSELRRKLTVMPAATVSDGLSNRDHDQILYGSAS